MLDDCIDNILVQGRIKKKKGKECQEHEQIMKKRQILNRKLGIKKHVNSLWPLEHSSFHY